ncbi:DMT family transporter [Yoonia vestfoldensis]|uniref:EamA-like transporter family protein n=1 Tax=Yoonia vestfoldensis TaxID=245188 RepID=A0A1Y0EEG9_9RHOB|nr:DMT family transporter [Yoonia vestfoldensis]ARU02003.1 EamA-like transporter family protein [Yoonia vestfoldensis]
MTPAQAGHLAMLCFATLVAGSFALGSLAANDIAPIALNAVRFWIAALILGVALLATGAVTRGAMAALWRYPLLAAFLTSYFVAMFEGLKTAAPVSAAAVFTLTPLMAGLFGWLLLGQRFTPRILLALLIGGSGALWVIFRADLSALLRFEIGRGEVIYLGGCLAHAVYTPLVRRLNRGEPALVFSFGVLLAGALLLTAFGWSDLRATDWTALPGMVWITILYTAIFASAATFTLLQFATMRLPSSKVMAYTYLVPSWVIIWGVALGAMMPPGIVMAGLGITIVALVLLLRED